MRSSLARQLEAMTFHSGRCRCGAISFVASGEPGFTGYCHCEDCRRASGAPVLAFVEFARADVMWTGEPARYGEAPVSRLFCASCGAPLAYEDERLPDVTFLYTAAMNEPEAYPPRSHSYHGERVAWLALADDLPRNDATSVPRPGETS